MMTILNDTIKLWQKFTFVLLLCLFFFTPTQAVQKQVGVGIALGVPTGLLFSYGLEDDTRLNFSIGWTYDRWGRGRDERYYYNDDRCNNNVFYNNNIQFCNDRYFRDNSSRRDGFQSFHFSGDYIIHNFSLFQTSEKIFLIYGPGLTYNRNFLYDENNIGIRGVIGIGWTHRSKPFDIFVQLAPTLLIFPGMDGDFSAIIGSHFYF